MSDRDELGAVMIGAREIYDELVALRGDVRSLTQTHEAVTQTLADHESRCGAWSGGVTPCPWQQSPPWAR